MPPIRVPDPLFSNDTVELSAEDAVFDTWLEDTGNYLRLDSDDLTPPEAPRPDQA